jgi:hypothetical protein
MREADMQRAWDISDRDLRECCRCGPAKHTGERHLQRIWRGEKLEGRRVLVRCYHGLGDTIQFVRFAKPLQDAAREVMIWVQPELLDLLRGVEGVDSLHPLHEGTPGLDYDVDIEIMELAHALRVTPEVITGRVPYLHAGQSFSRRFMPTGQRRPISIGLVWEAGNWDRRRCVPPRELRKLGAVPGIQLYSLQQGPGRVMSNVIPAEDIAVPDIESLATTIMGLDLILTIDTMVAHLAGALGVPVWTMLHADCDWRWPQAGRKSMWYSSMTLFHQPSPGDWEGLLEQVADELNHFVRAGCDR